MNYSFFLILVFVTGLSLVSIPDSFAETITGYDHFDRLNPDGSHTWSSHHPYVLNSNGDYVPFIQNNNSIQTALDAVTLNPDGSYSWEEKGITDRIVAKYADISDLNSWTYPNGLNNATPEISWNGTAFVSEKNNDNIGNLKYIYSLNGISWKTQLEAKNLSTLTTKVFGFDEIFDLDRDTIKFGGVDRNLDNFNGTTFDKEFLDANQGKVIDLLNGATFDFDKGYENLHSITVYDTGINSSRLVFDYRMTDVLLPGDTFIIDPTFGYIDSGQFRAQTTSGDSTTCDASTGATWSISTSDTVYMQGTPSNYCGLVSFYWDVSAIPDTAIITDVDFQYDITIGVSGKTCEYMPFSHNPTDYNSSGDAYGLWHDIINGTAYYSSDTNCNTIANDYSIDLGSSADTDLQNDLIDNEFAIGVHWTEGEGVGSLKRADFSGENNLIVTYTQQPPDSITDLTLDSATDTTATVSFTPPSLNGGNLTTYTFNLSTPQTDNVQDFFGNSTDNPFTFTGLDFGTSYSANATAITEGGGNYTLANVLNFTTTIPITSFNSEVLIVGGAGAGGGGTGNGGGGGGAGGYRTDSPILSIGAYPVTVGTVNNDSIFNGLTASAGGNGGASTGAGNDGGSGGGGAGNGGAGGNGNTPATTPSQGNDGGAGAGSGSNGGGGGGAGGAGSSGGGAGGAGGAGISNDITGASLTYSSGGTGGTAGNDGSPGTGCQSTSGCVIIRYLTEDAQYTGGVTGGTITTDGDYTIHKFTSSGTFTILPPSDIEIDIASFDIEIVGDAAKITGLVNIANGSNPFTNQTGITIFANGSAINTNTTSTNGTVPYSVNFGPIWYYIATDNTYNFTAQVFAQNTTQTVSNSSSILNTREYDPDYFTAVDPTEGLVNYTFTGTNILQVNRDTNGTLFQVECQYYTQAQAFLNNLESGVWDNETDVLFYTSDVSGYYYVQCFNSGELFVSAINQNFSNALVPGLVIFDQLGGFFGAPSILLVILSILSLGTGRNYPIILLIAASVTGILLALELLTLDPGLVVALIVMAGIGLFGIRKFY